MSAWRKVARFRGKLGSVRLGQPMELDLDIGKAIAAGHEVRVKVIDGDIFDGQLTDEEDEIKELLPPISREECSLIRCLGLNYKKHAEEAGMALPKDPILFIKPRTALTGPGAIKVCKVAQDEQLDFETELALVIGRDARDVKEEDALNYVLGYTASNDVSMRKFQLSNSQWCFGKGFDDSCPIGPVLVRASEINPDNLNLKGTLSGEVVQQSNTSDMIFTCRKAMAFLSQGTTIEKGTVIQMGTPSGIGWAREPKRTIKDGETMEICFEGIGTLINTFQYI